MIWARATQRLKETGRNMNYATLTLVGAAMVFMASTGVASAQDIRPLSQIKTSGEVYALGVETRDPLLIIAAAKIRKQTNLTPTDRQPEGGGDLAEGGFLDWSKMLDVAQDFASGDNSMLGLIEDVRAENSKGVIDGPLYSIIKIKSGGNDTYKSLPFEGGKYAEIYIEGNGNSDLNLFVYDDQNRLVCSDTDASDIAYCGWRPVSSAPFSVTVKNKGGSSNQYSLITN
jgi:hypothetical protein